MEDHFVYRLATPDQWAASRRQGVLAKSAIDERDGFIHLSTAGQLVQTANLHFQDHDELWALLFDRQALEEKLKWEDVPGRWDKMPHYYGELTIAEVRKSFLMRRNPGGSFGIVTKGAI